MSSYLRMITITCLAVLFATSAVPAQDEEAPIQVPLRENLRFLVRPTLMGLVPPADEQGYGEAFIRVIQSETDLLQIRYEIKERWEPEESSEETDVPPVRIRRGAIDILGCESGLGMHPLLFWPDGDWSTATGLLWVPRASFRELKEAGACDWALDHRVTGETERSLAGALEQALPDARRAQPDLRLLVGEPAMYPCWINGERSALPAVRATDSQGLADYWILDDPDNPLVLKLSFVPPETEEEDHGGELGLLEAGAGYAVVEVDF
ncbi:hypothetical protein JW859_10705 [bacterium]|nr:hypothetical protein [bacterium]